ncbi:MAG: methyltransferase domain-containing protein [Hyphomicrobium sp.]
MTPMTLSRQRHGLLAQCLAERAEPVARSPRFTVYRLAPEPATAACDRDDIILVHDFTPPEIDNNIARYVADELLPLLSASAPRAGAHNDYGDDYGASDQEVFERFVGEIVRSMDGNERRAWHLFYDNTLAALDRAGQEKGGTRDGSDTPRDYIADFAAIYRRVGDLVAEIAPASLLDVATCFGFLPLLLASGAGSVTRDRQGLRCIVGCDLNPALVTLAASYVRQRELTGVRFVEADILDAQALPEASFDVVTAIHLLEHLEPAQTASAMEALWALARRRLIVAVPVETVPDTRFGHRQVFTQESLRVLGQRTTGTSRCFEDHGAWLVIDRDEEQDGRSHGGGEARA